MFNWQDCIYYLLTPDEVITKNNSINSSVEISFLG